MKEIKVGSIVRYGSGWYRVTRCTKNIVNLGAVFGNHIYHKSVDKSLVSEDEGSWYANWVQSDTYRSM